MATPQTRPTMKHATRLHTVQKLLSKCREELNQATQHGDDLDPIKRDITVLQEYKKLLDLMEARKLTMRQLQSMVDNTDLNHASQRQGGLNFPR